MASSRPILEDLPFCLARTSLSFRRFNDQTLRAVGLQDLAPGYASVLHAVKEQGDCTVNCLVEKTHLANGTLTGVLDGLEKDGYIQRVHNPRDGRSWLIQLTRNGRQVCRKLQVRHGMVMDIFNDVFSDAEATDLARLLGKITERMRTYVPEAGPPLKSVGRAKKVARKAKLSNTAKSD